MTLNNRNNSNFGAFRGGHDAGYMGLAPSTWVPMGAQVPVLSPNDHPNPSHGHQRDFGKSRKFEHFPGDTKQPDQHENSEVLIGKGPVGGGGGGFPEFGPETPAMVSGPRSQPTHSADKTQKSFDPNPPTHPPTPKKMGYPGTGGGMGGQNRKIRWKIIFWPKR